ncbi:ACP S-malonyltransferase [Altererythrobacter salegens]|uniref:Malonyl CoA-acyl carrier protein transacylase n=1 Tax=Croceibacterium salegens TaxID=1737568 RepID=A0A6I4SVM3_9SPHN|nr:ACP S-malonyltransferase [Croceibacterium salegens]MXO59110.1 ACP S-malonyltransferase [Croceibacterium salegens]
MVAFVFPGQGSQRVGMGVELADNSRFAREVFQEVDEALSQKLSLLMREGPEEELMLTVNAQPAIMATSIATLRVLEGEFGVDISKGRAGVAGHSLGEYTALCAIGAFSLAETARLLKLRGRSMQDAVPVGEGAMAALLGADLEKATALVEAAAQGEVCQIANDNDPTQVVISGHAGAIDRAVHMAKEFGIKRGVKLAVSAPFHSSLMQPAAEAMREALAEMPPHTFTVPIYSNVTAGRVTDAEEERSLLVEQVTGRVRWRESILAMREAKIQRYVELGGKVLAPMISRIDPEATPFSLVTMEDLENYARENA